VRGVTRRVSHARLSVRDHGTSRGYIRTVGLATLSRVHPRVAHPAKTPHIHPPFTRPTATTTKRKSHDVTKGQGNVRCPSDTNLPTAPRVEALRYIHEPREKSTLSPPPASKRAAPSTCIYWTMASITITTTERASLQWGGFLDLEVPVCHQSMPDPCWKCSIALL
jgi:hypothetical protein